MSAPAISLACIKITKGLNHFVVSHKILGEVTVGATHHEAEVDSPERVEVEEIWVNGRDIAMCLFPEVFVDLADAVLEDINIGRKQRAECDSEDVAA